MVDSWLQPLEGDACGDDLEYDPAFLELDQAAAGKPETQFGPAEPPQWAQVLELAEGLLGRTRDLRVGLLWGRAVLNIDGLEALAPTLRLIHGFLDRFWDEVHPRNDPDDGDTFARLSVLGTLDKLDGFLGDVRQVQVLNDRRLGGLRIREIEIGLDRLPARPDESVRTTAQIQGLLTDVPELGDRLRTCQVESIEAVKELQRVMNDRFGLELAVDLRALRGMVEALKLVLPEPVGEDGSAGEGSGNAEQQDGGGVRSAGAARRGGGLQSIESRDDAIKALRMICAYLERSEPTNPAQLLLRRAERLIDKSFLQLVRDLAPDAVSEVARIMGVDPDSIEAIERAS
ncbi:MAG: type VI secretion system protein TssA [Caldimonas sp.]